MNFSEIRREFWLAVLENPRSRISDLKEALHELEAAEHKDECLLCNGRLDADEIDYFYDMSASDDIERILEDDHGVVGKMPLTAALMVDIRTYIESLESRLGLPEAERFFLCAEQAEHEAAKMRQEAE